LKDWHKQFDINVHGVFYSAQAVAKYMLEQGKGSIIFTSSVSALVANRPQFQCAVSIPSQYVDKNLQIYQFSTTVQRVPLV
jgi:NAD(P)-dependent dehydrogenase (short-subunit alcohol dehydrogenase family)